MYAYLDAEKLFTDIIVSWEQKKPKAVNWVVA